MSGRLLKIREMPVISTHCKWSRWYINQMNVGVNTLEGPIAFVDELCSRRFEVVKETTTISAR